MRFPIERTPVWALSQIVIACAILFLIRSKGHYNLAILYSRLNNPQRAQEEMSIIEKLKSEGKTQENEADIVAPAVPASCEFSGV